MRVPLTHCKRGHEFTEENTRRRAALGFSRECRTCIRMHCREYRRRHQKPPKPPEPPQTHCKHGHELAEENIYVTRKGNRRCRTCSRAGGRKHYRANSEKVLARTREYVKERKPAWSREKDGKRNRRWDKANPDKRRAYELKYREANPEKVRETSRRSGRKWKKAHPERARAACAAARVRRRALVRKQMGNFSPWMIRYYKYCQSNLCFYCGCDISKEYHLEHMTPLSRGGLHDWTNTVLSCPTCNARKGTKTVEEFATSERATRSLYVHQSS